MEDVLPFEKELYVMMLINHLEEEESKAKKAGQGY